MSFAFIQTCSRCLRYLSMSFHIRKTTNGRQGIRSVRVHELLSFHVTVTRQNGISLHIWRYFYLFLKQQIFKYKKCNV